MTLADDPGFTLLLRRLEGRGVPRLDIYKERCLRRRLAVRMRACGVTTLTAYVEQLDRRPEEVEHLLAALTINVTTFFRNPTSWVRLEAALAGLVRHGAAPLAGWSAGCATGEEAWTAAMVLSEVAGGRGGVPGRRRPRVRVDGTDVDAGCLETAKRAEYPATAFAEAPAALIRRWTEPAPPGRRIGHALRRAVTFHRHDLARDPAPHPPYDLVVCRNVMIYFSPPTQEAVLLRFAEALRLGGLLLLGKVESLVGAARERFAPVDGRERLFRRVA